MKEGRSLLPSVEVRYHCQTVTPTIGYKAQQEQTRDPKHHRFGQALYGPWQKTSPTLKTCPYDFHDEVGMVKLKTVAGIKSPVEVSAEI